VDRFGPLPREASSLLKVAAIRPALKRNGIQRLEEQNGWVSLTWHEARTPGEATVEAWMKRIPPSRIRFNPQNKNMVSFRITKGNEPEEVRLDAVGNLLRELL
jgi:transcription-repair coupling factor (superfamily II helicase)